MSPILYITLIVDLVFIFPVIHLTYSNAYNCEDVMSLKRKLGFRKQDLISETNILSTLPFQEQ